VTHKYRKSSTTTAQIYENVIIIRVVFSVELQNRLETRTQNNNYRYKLI